MAKSPWAYIVSPEQRQREVVENTRLIAQYDAWLQLALDIPTWCTDGCADTVMVACTDAVYAKGMGLSVRDAACLADYADVGDHIAKWLYMARQVAVPDWYARGMATAEVLCNRYGPNLYSREATQARRKDAVRRLRTAKNALGLK